jgi:hypothetical protein
MLHVGNLNTLMQLSRLSLLKFPLATQGRPYLAL